MAAKLKGLLPVLASFFVVVVVSLGVIYFMLNPVPQTELHLGCTTDSPRMTLIAPATVYSGAMKWSPMVGPNNSLGNLPAGTEVCLVGHDDFNARYAQVVFPDPQGNGEDDKFVRGWVELETLPLAARDVRLSINSPWESSTYP